MKGLHDDLRRFLQETFLLGTEEKLGDEDSLLGRGILDSTGVLELVGHLERTYGITVADEEMVPENLDSIARIAAFLERKGAVERRTP